MLEVKSYYLMYYSRDSRLTDKAEADHVSETRIVLQNPKIGRFRKHSADTPINSPEVWLHNCRDRHVANCATYNKETAKC